MTRAGAIPEARVARARRTSRPAASPVAEPEFSGASWPHPAHAIPVGAAPRRGGAPMAAPDVEKKRMTVLQATFIGVGSMVGAGIFALLGAAGEVAGSAVWLSFLIAGVIAGLQGYSFAKLGAKYPTGGG